MAGKETVLYYSPNKDAKVRKVKSVLVRLGIRIKNISEEQFGEQVGTLAGLTEFAGKRKCPLASHRRQVAPAMQKTLRVSPALRPDETDMPGPVGKQPDETGNGGASDADTAVIPEEVLVLCNFTEAGLDRLLRELRKSNATVALKAVLTETNCAWSFYELYREVRREHEIMSRR